MSAQKRRNIENGTPSKRRQVEIPRLCDLREGSTLFMNEVNEAKAKEKGYLRSRDASEKYQELEKRLFTLFKESGEITFPSEDWVFEVLPELNDLEPDTLDALLCQAVTHAKYERAARELVQRERARIEQEHDAEIRTVRAEGEAEITRSSTWAETQLKHADDAARSEMEELRNEAVEKIKELEETIEELESTIEGQKEQMVAMEDAHEAEVETLKDESRRALDSLAAAQEETDLKREASKKLKEEIIDNDKLTVANLNRIKHLEAMVEQHKAALEEADNENHELRSELAKSVDPSDHSDKTAECEALRELLAEREAHILSLSRRLEQQFEPEVGSERRLSGGNGSGRRDSFLERFQFGNPRGLLASSSA